MCSQLDSDPTVADIQPLERAHVPMIGFTVTAGSHRIDVDLLFASVADVPLPADFDVHADEAILRCTDQQSARSLNGPRSTEQVLRLVPAHAHATFLEVLRAVRLWARRRDLYSNKLGFLGGINLCLLAAHVTSLYPNAAAAVVLERFFWIYKQWAWPAPVSLRPPRPQPTGDGEWSAEEHPGDVMPILTPAFPSANSAPLITPTSLAIIREEMAVAHEQVSRYRAAPRTPLHAHMHMPDPCRGCASAQHKPHSTQRARTQRTKRTTPPPPPLPPVYTQTTRVPRTHVYMSSRVT